MVFLRISLAGQIPQGSAKVARRFRKVPQWFSQGFSLLGRFRKVPQRFRESCEGSARFRESCGKVPQGSAKVPRNFLRLSLASKVPQGSAEVPRKLREGSARFRGLRVAGCEVPRRFREDFAKFLKAFPCFQGSTRFREGSAKVAGRFRKVPRKLREGSARFREGSA